MWSDTSVEAAHAVLRSAGCYAPWDVLRAALEAAEAAAWISDMDAAPRDGQVLLRTPDYIQGSVRIGWPEDWVDATAWRPLPQPPAETGGRE